MNGLSKRLVSLTMATAMVFSLTAVPATEAKAAKASITSKTTSVQADKTYTYKIEASKAKKVKVSVSGTAAKAVRVNGKKATSGKNTITLKGGKTLTVEVKVKPTKTVAGKKFTVNYKLSNKKKAVKTKSIKVNYSTKGVTLDQTAVSLKVGETATLKATMTTEGSNSTIKSWVSSDEKVATVNNGVVTAVAAGTADITVTTSNGKTAKATVTVEDTEKKPEAFTLTASATKADTITGTLSREVAADATVTVMKDGIATPVDGKATFNGTKVEFKATANFTNGTYTITVKEGELSADAKVTVQDEYVKEIVIKSTQALTNGKGSDTPFGTTGTTRVPEGTVAYIYYDVLNQYGESLRASTTINWTTSSGEAKVEKATGKIAVQNGTSDPKPFTYGSLIYVTGVYSKTGVSVSQAVPVGLAQSVDSVKAVGFVNKNDPSKLLKELPVNFTKDDYRMLYETYDQDGNALDASTASLADQGITFISDAPLLIDSNFKEDNTTYTIDGTQYSALQINPGKYVDKGGEVNITAISNNTGTKTVTNFVIGKAVMLQSLTISTPNRVVAHGDQGVGLPFVAKDTEGNTVTNYETIVRSSNALTISCTRGDVRVYEKADGTAGISWSDDDQYNFTDSNGIDIPVSITTVVVGGTSENFMLNLQDTRIPVAIKSVKINDSNDAVVAGYTYGWNDLLKWNTVYLDQYGDVLDTTWPVLNQTPAKFFKWAQDNEYVQGSQKLHFGIRIDTTKSGSGVSSNVVDVTDFGTVAAPSAGFALKTKYGSSVVSAPVKYSIIAQEDGKTNWDIASKVTTQTYSVVPTDKLGGLSFGDVAKQQLITSMSDEDNAVNVLESNKTNVVSGNTMTSRIDFGSNDQLKINGVYNGTWVKVPTDLWSATPECGFVFDDDKLDYFEQASAEDQILIRDLYDFNTTKNVRKDTKRTLVANVFQSEDNMTSIQTVKADVVMSDAPSQIASVELITDNILRARNTDRDFANAFTPIDCDNWDPTYGNAWSTVTTSEYLAREYGAKKHGNDYILVKDQYGHVLDSDDHYNVTYKIDNYVEHTGDFAHMVNSIVITGSGTAKAELNKAELGDKFDLTVTVEGVSDNKVYGSASTKVAFTMGADYLANISSRASGVEATNDYDLRTTLGLIAD